MAADGPIILGTIDGATRTGWAVASATSGVPRMRVGSWQAPPGSSTRQKIDFHRERLVKFIREEGIGYFFVEQPTFGVTEKEVTIQTPIGFEKKTKLSGQAGVQNELWALHGAFIAIIGAFNIPYRTALAVSWRAGLWRGEGRMGGDEAKRRCKEMLAKHDIYCPNKDAAEAGAMAFYANLMLRRWQAEDELLARRAA